MRNQMQVCLFNNEPASADALREAFVSLPEVEVVHTASHWDELCGVIKEGQANAVVVNLDDNVDFGLNLVQRLVQSHPDIAVVGISRRADPNTIISAMRAGCAQFVCAPIDVNDLSRALERVRQRRTTSAAPQSRRICVVGSTGGAGATTIACNLALELADLTDRRTSLVDLNLEFGDVACALDCEPKHSLADLCCGGSAVDETLVRSVIHDLPNNVSILGRPDRVEDARHVTPEGVEQALAAMSSMYPYVVIDLPRSFGFLSTAALHGTDTVLIVTQLSVPGVRNATRLYELLLSMGAPKECLQIVLNRCKADFEHISPSDVEKHFSRPVFAMIPNDYRRVMAAREFGHPIVAKAPSSIARLAIRDMAKKIAAVGAGVAAKPGKRPGLFKRILSRR